MTGFATLRPAAAGDMASLGAGAISGTLGTALRSPLPDTLPDAQNLAPRPAAPFGFPRVDIPMARGRDEAGAPTRRLQPAPGAFGPANLDRRFGRLFRNPEWEVERALA